MCSKSSERCFLFKTWSECKFFSPLRLSEPQNVIMKLATVDFLWCHQDPAQDFLIAQIKHQWGREREKTVSLKPYTNCHQFQPISIMSSV